MHTYDIAYANEPVEAYMLMGKQVEIMLMGKQVEKQVLTLLKHVLTLLALLVQKHKY